MVWAVVSVLGFLVVTGLVTAMARSNTARWERDHRAPQVAARAHGAAMRRAWLTTLTRWQEQEDEAADAGARRHLHLPHVHLPAGLGARLPHPHVPELHLPHLHLPHVRIPGRGRPVTPSPAGSAATGSADTGSPAAGPPPEEPPPTGADADRTGVAS